MPDTTDTNPNAGERTPRNMSTLIRRALAALDLWIAEESADDAVDHYDRLLPWERVGDLDEERAFMTALALSPRCLVGQQVPQAALAFIANCDAAHPERGLAARFESRAEGDVLALHQVRDEMRKTLQLLWPECELWDAVPKGSHGIENYRYDLDGERFWYLPHMTSYSATSINGAVGFSNWPLRTDEDGEPAPVPPSQWLKDSDNGQTFDGVSWVPGAPLIIRNTLFTKEGKQRILGRNTLNEWKPGPTVQDDAPPADRWLNLGERMFLHRVEREEFLNRLAFIVQKPGQIVPGFTGIIGPQGVGKDAMLLPLNYALGWHNVRNVTPDDVVRTFNSWLRSQLVILNELRLDPREGGGHELYSKMKSYFMTPPDIVMINDKNEKLRAHLKSASCLVTSNDLAGFHLPPDERRAFLPEIRLKPRWHIDEGKPEFFTEYFRWLRHERGYAAVHKYLATRDISGYDPTKLPPATRTKRQAQEITKGGDNTIARAIEKLGRPEVFFEIELHDLARRDVHGLGIAPDHDLLVALRAKSRVQLFESAGYVRFPHPEGKDWETTVRKAASGDIPAQKRRKKSAAAYVRQEVWGLDEEVVARHLKHRLRRLALGDPRLTDNPYGGDTWPDPATGQPPEPLPPLLPVDEAEDGAVEETANAEAAAQEADAWEA